MLEKNYQQENIFGYACALLGEKKARSAEKQTRIWNCK